MSGYSQQPGQSQPGQGPAGYGGPPGARQPGSQPMRPGFAAPVPGFRPAAGGQQPPSAPGNPPQQRPFGGHPGQPVRPAVGGPSGPTRPGGAAQDQRQFSGGAPAPQPGFAQRQFSGGAPPGGPPSGFRPPSPGIRPPFPGPQQSGIRPMANGVGPPALGPPGTHPGVPQQSSFSQPPRPGPRPVGPSQPGFQAGPPRPGFPGPGFPGGAPPPGGFAAPQGAQPPAFGATQPGGFRPAGPPGFGGGPAAMPGVGGLSAPTQSILEQFESLSLGPSGPGQPMGVSPASLPRPVGEGAEDAVAPPPLANPRNCPSRYMRVTVSAIPSQQGLRARYQLPIGAIVHPLADPQDVPVISLNGPSIVRCQRCRTYINPFVTWQDGGRRFVCNVCGMLTEIPMEYFCSLDHTGQRTDVESRPELRSGSVEYVAPAEYMVRPPMPPVFFFVIDVSVTAINSGMLATTTAAIKSTLDNLPGADRTRVGFLTYDAHLQFYNLKSTLTQPQMMVVSEVDEPFVPLPEDLIVNLHESRDVVDALLDSLPTIFATNLSPESAMGPALQAAFMVMNPLGGKLLIFQSSVPSIGAGTIKKRNEQSMWNTDQEHKLRLPDNPFWKKFAAECSRVQIAVDVFSFCREYTDLASIGALPKYTCGQLYYYPSFSRERDGIKLTHEIVHNLTRTTGWEAVMRIRCSKGLRISGFHGHFFIRSTDLLALPQVDPDKAFAVQIAHEENVVTTQVSYIQCALLYTSSSGERRIRVHTLMLPVVNDIGELYRTADGGAMATLVAKLAVEKSYQSKLDETRSAIQNKLVVALKEYRLIHQQQAAQSRISVLPNLLVFPPTLRYLALWTLGLMKTAAIRGSARDVLTDERIAVGLDLMSASTSTLLRLVYPSMYPLHDPQGPWGRPAEDGRIVLPPLVPLSVDALQPQGAYLLDNGRVFILWLGREVSPAFLHQVFGIDPQTHRPTDGSSTSVEPARKGSELSERINALLQSLRSARPNYQNVFIVRQGSPQEANALPYFVEDRSPGQYSYLEFMNAVHKQILSAK